MPSSRLCSSSVPLFNEECFYFSHMTGGEQVNSRSSAELDVRCVQPPFHVGFVFVQVAEHREYEVIGLAEPDIELLTSQVNHFCTRQHLCKSVSRDPKINRN